MPLQDGPRTVTPPPPGFRRLQNSPKPAFQGGPGDTFHSTDLAQLGDKGFKILHAGTTDDRYSGCDCFNRVLTSPCQETLPHHHHVGVRNPVPLLTRAVDYKNCLLRVSRRLEPASEDDLETGPLQIRSHGLPALRVTWKHNG